MSRASTVAQPLRYSSASPVAKERGLGMDLILLAAPILAEHLLNMFVGLTDVYLAGHLKVNPTDATAAIGVVAYLLWLVGLVAGSIATGSSAIIARATGARHRSLVNSVTGQSVGAALIAGIAMAAVVAIGAGSAAASTGLTGQSHDYALFYFRLLPLALPCNMVMLTANACLRGAGDTLTPAVAMIMVDGVNMLLSAALVHGWGPFPEMGYRGIAIGTVVAYSAGGVLQFAVLWSGQGKARLFLHRLRPHWSILRRVLHIGLPSGLEGTLTWGAQATIMGIIVRLDRSPVTAAAHIVTIRAESLSYTLGLAVSTAAATLVGQSLGMRNPARATRASYLAFALGAGAMACWGAAFIFFGRRLAGLVTSDPDTIALAGRCLAVTAWAQIGFAATLVFGGALRGAGDTLAVMLINLASTLGLRLVGVLVITIGLGYGLVAIWVVLASELSLRGVLMYLRFLSGRWQKIEV